MAATALFIKLIYKDVKITSAHTIIITNKSHAGMYVK